MKTPLLPLFLALTLSTPALAAEPLRGSERRDGHQTPSIRDQIRATATRTPDASLRAAGDAARAAGDARAAMTSASAQDSTQAPGAGFSGSFDATATAQLPPPPIMEPPPATGSCRWRWAGYPLREPCDSADGTCANIAPTGFTFSNGCPNTGPGALVNYICMGDGSWQTYHLGECGGT